MFRELVIGGPHSIMASAAQDVAVIYAQKVRESHKSVRLLLFGHLAVPLSPVISLAVYLPTKRSTQHPSKQVVTAVHIARPFVLLKAPVVSSPVGR